MLTLTDLAQQKLFPPPPLTHIHTLTQTQLSYFGLRQQAEWWVHIKLSSWSAHTHEHIDTQLLSRSDPVTSTPSIGQLLLVTPSWQLTQGLRLGRIHCHHWKATWHTHTRARTYTHIHIKLMAYTCLSHKRKIHSGQKNFVESAEWLVRQPDPLCDAHHQLFESMNTHAHTKV